MTLDELREHCLKTLKYTQKFPTKTFEEHALVLQLIENQTSVIPELEKIKAEIERLKPNNPNFEHYVGETRAINNALEVIDNHIKELKGEQDV